MAQTIITIQGENIYGQKISDRFYSKSQADTDHKMRWFAKAYNLINVCLL